MNHKLFGLLLEQLNAIKQKVRKKSHIIPLKMSANSCPVIKLNGLRSTMAKFLRRNFYGLHTLRGSSPSFRDIKKLRRSCCGFRALINFLFEFNYTELCREFIFLPVSSYIRLVFRFLKGRWPNKKKWCKFWKLEDKNDFENFFVKFCN